MDRDNLDTIASVNIPQGQLEYTRFPQPIAVYLLAGYDRPEFMTLKKFLYSFEPIRRKTVHLKDKKWEIGAEMHVQSNECQPYWNIRVYTHVFQNE